MNNTHLSTGQTASDQFGRRITARLSDAANNLPYEISERLRAARVQAVEKRKWVLLQTANPVFMHNAGGTLIAGHGPERARWWHRLGAIGLLLILVTGLFAINAVQDELGARELADIDAAILTDELPPGAYVDAGFAQFLKTSNHQEH